MTQLRFKAPKVDIEVSATKLRPYSIKKGDEGWMVYDQVSQLVQQQEASTTYLPADTFLEFGDRMERTIVSINRDRLKGVILRPVLRLAPKVADGAVYDPGISWVQDNYSFYPNIAQWDFNRSESGLFVECTQKYNYPPGTTQAQIANGSVAPYSSGLDYRGSYIDSDNYTGMCPNGFFAVGVRRGAIPPEFQQWVEENVSYSAASQTNVYFGGNSLGSPRWLLQIPLMGSPVLYENVNFAGNPEEEREPSVYPLPYWVLRPWTEGSLSAVTPAKIATDGMTYKVGAIGRAICVSESSFEDDFAYYLVGENKPDFIDNLQPVIPAGPVQVRNWPGACTIWLDLLEFPGAGVLQRYPFEVPKIDVGKTFAYWNRQPKPLEGVEDNDVLANLVTVSDTAPYKLRYDMILRRGVFPSEALSMPTETPTYTTPFLEAVTSYKWPVLDENALRWTKPQNVPIELNSDLAMGSSEAQHHRLTVDNRAITNPPSGPVPESGYVPAGVIGVGREVKITAGWIYEQPVAPAAEEPGDGEEEGGNGDEAEKDWTVTEWEEVPALVQQGVFTVIEPSYNVREANFDLTDMLGLLALKRWEWGTVSVRGWPLHDFIVWLMEDAGIGAKLRDIENLGIIVPADTDHATWENGTPYAQIITECIERFASGVSSGGGPSGAALWYDGQDNKIKTGCRYCRTKRNMLNWEAHQDNGWASSGCLAADELRIAGGVDFTMVDRPEQGSDFASLFIAKSVEVRVVPIRDGRYANRIVVIGKTRGGAPIYSRWTNEAALYHGEGIPGEEFIGFPVTHTEEDSSLQTQEQCDNRLDQLVQWLSGWPRMVSILAPLMPEARPGMVLKVSSGRYAGIHGKTFRITNVSHQLQSHETGIEAREITGTGGGAE